MSAASAPPKPRSGARRAATLLMLLGDDVASQVLSHMSEREVESIGAEIIRLDRVDPAELKEVVVEYLGSVPPEGGIAGGPERLAKLLSASRGGEGKRILDRIFRQVERPRPVDVAEIDPAALAGLLEAEPPQAVALLMSRLEPKVAGAVMARLSPDLRQAVASRLARLGAVDHEAVEQLLGTLRLRLKNLGESPGAAADGVRLLAGILNHTGANLSSEVLDGLETEDAELAAKVRDQAVVFDDIMYVEDRAMPTFVQRVDKKVLAMALKGTTEEMQAKFFRGMSERAGQNLKEEMQLLGPVRVSEVETAQTVVVAALKKLVEEGAVVLNKGGDGFVA